VIQSYSYLDVADNTGAKKLQCIQVLKGSSGRHGKKRLIPGGVGDIAKGDKIRCVIVRTKYPTRRNDGSYVRFDSNAAVIIDDDGNPKGTRVFGAVARELREKNFTKIISLAEEVW
jgi:large subunit ribosomal protein L14